MQPFFLSALFLIFLFNITSNYGNILLLRYKEFTIYSIYCLILQKILP